jgi:hypothetical protein
MTVQTIFQPGFGQSQQRNRWWRDRDGAWATTTPDIAMPVHVPWTVIDVLESGVTVSSVAYEDRGAVSSSKSLATPVITFTLTGYGDCKVTATLSAGGPIVQLFRIYPVDAAFTGSTDYGNR